MADKEFIYITNESLEELAKLLDSVQNYVQQDMMLVMRDTISNLYDFRCNLQNIIESEEELKKFVLKNARSNVIEYIQAYKTGDKKFISIFEGIYDYPEEVYAKLRNGDAIIDAETNDVIVEI